MERRLRKVDSFEQPEINNPIMNNTVQSMQTEEESPPKNSGERKLRKVKSFETPVQTQSPKESWPEWGLRNATRLGSRAAEAAIGAPRGIIELGEMGYNALPNLISPETKKEIYPSEEEYKGFGDAYEKAKSFLPSGQQVHEIIASALPEGYTEPKGGWEDFADDLAHEVPFLAAAAATGGLSALGWGAGKALTSSISGQGAKALGWGPGAQFAARLAGSLGSDIFKHKMSGKNIQKFANVARKKDYAEAKVPASNLYFEGDNLADNLNPILKKVSGNAPGLGLSAQNAVKREAMRVEDLIEKHTKSKWSVNPETGIGRKTPGRRNPHAGEINLQKAVEQKQQLNKRIKQLSTTSQRAKQNEDEINYYKQLTGVINEQIKPLESKYPEFGVPYRKAELATEVLGDIRKMQSTIKEAYEDLGKIPGVGRHLRVALKDLKWIFQREPTAAMWKFYRKDPKTLYKYAGSLINDALVGDKPGVLRNIELINRMMTSK